MHKRYRIGVCIALIGSCGPEAATSTSTGSTGATSGMGAPTTSDPGGLDTTAVASDLPPLDPEATCSAYCTQWNGCQGFPPDAQCVALCLDGLGDERPDEAACFAADVALVACRAGLPCDDLQGDQAGCADARWSFGIACRVCWGDAGWTGPDACFFADVCPSTRTRRIDCDASVCTCTIDGAPGGGCPSLGCDQDGLPNVSFDCCV